VDWDTGETIFGERADIASPWKTSDAPPIEEIFATQPGPFQTLMSGLLNVIGMFGGGVNPSGFITNQNGTKVWYFELSNPPIAAEP
jgi:hypothetical protein